MPKDYAVRRDLMETLSRARGERDPALGYPDCEDMWLALGSSLELVKELAREMAKPEADQHDRWTVPKDEFGEVMSRAYESSWQALDRLREQNCRGDTAPIRRMLESRSPFDTRDPSSALARNAADWASGWNKVYSALLDSAPGSVVSDIEGENEEQQRGKEAGTRQSTKAVCTSGKSPTELEQNINEILRDAQNQGYEVTDMAAAREEDETICVLLHEAAEEME